MRIILRSMLIVCMVFLWLMSCERADMETFATEIPIQSGVLIFNAQMTTGNIGGRLGADNLCNVSLQSHNLVFKEFSRAKAFISVDELDTIRYVLPVEYWYLPVYGIGGSMGFTQISANWIDLWDGTIDNNLSVALGLTTVWWSGSYPDGSLWVGGTCNGWTSDTAGGIYGDNASISGSWLYAASGTCGSAYQLLCVAY